MPIQEKVMSSQWIGSAGIEERLQSALMPIELTVQDDSAQHAGHSGAREGGHYTVRITCEKFSGLSRMARHRLVYDALGPLAPQGIHALAIQARAPGEH
jgi:BolA family transcriptional regulator, general stress-responsive regulator